MSHYGQRNGDASAKGDTRKQNALRRLVEEQGDVYVVRLLAGVLSKMRDAGSRRLGEALAAAADDLEERRSNAVEKVLRS